jgi:hypothetical protein
MKSVKLLALRLSSLPFRLYGPYPKHPRVDKVKPALLAGVTRELRSFFRRRLTAFAGCSRSIRKASLLLLLLSVSSLAHAQQVAGGLQNLVDQIKLIANVIFIGAIIWAAVRTVIAFAGGSPTAMRNVLYTIIIALFWFGFNYFVDDIASSLGGAGADTFGG